jgi:hypothetical protein
MMKKRVKTIIHKSIAALLLGTLAAAVALAATDDPEAAHAGHGPVAPAKLVQTVRNATEQFINVNAAIAAGYQPLFGCVSGPDQGAMGVHYINLGLYSDGMIDATRPEALIYEPSANGSLVLVGAEYIVDAATWLAHNTTVVADARRSGFPAREQPEPVWLTRVL